MPWITPFPNEWDAWYAARKNVGWPIVDDVRRLTAFWFVLMSQNISPTMPRVITRFHYRADPNEDLWSDIALSGTVPGDLFGSSGVNGLGQEITLRLLQRNDPGDPIDMRGVQWEFTYSRVGFADDIVSKYFVVADYLQGAYVPFDESYQESGVRPPPDIWTNNWTALLDTDWTQQFSDIACIFACTSTRRDLPLNP